MRKLAQPVSPAIRMTLARTVTRSLPRACDPWVRIDSPQFLPVADSTTVAPSPSSRRATVSRARECAPDDRPSETSPHCPHCPAVRSVASALLPISIRIEHHAIPPALQTADISDAARMDGRFRRRLPPTRRRRHNFPGSRGVQFCRGLQLHRPTEWRSALHVRAGGVELSARARYALAVWRWIARTFVLPLGERRGVQSRDATSMIRDIRSSRSSRPLGARAVCRRRRSDMRSSQRSTVRPNTPSETQPCAKPASRLVRSDLARVTR